MNFVFCEREPYAGTAPEQKTKSAKSHFFDFQKIKSIFGWSKPQPYK